MNLHKLLFGNRSGTDIWVLIDPDSQPISELINNVRFAESEGVTAILIGGSFLSNDNFNEVVKAVKANTKIPVVLFPGNSRQLSRHADGLLFTSLLSGRNPQFLIGEQVVAAPFVFQMKLPTIPTAYLLIESGRTTSAQFISDTHPIPRDKPRIVVAHALAASLMGMKAVYLEAGSGADKPVPADIISAVAKNAPISLIVGGGINNPSDAITAAKSGADAIVIGTVVEKKGNSVIREIVQAVKECNI